MRQVTSHQKFRRALEKSLESEPKVQQILDPSQDIEAKKQIVESGEIRISEQTKQSLEQYREELREKQAYAEKHDPTQTQQYRKNTYLEVQAALGTLSEDIDRAIEEDRDLESIARSIESRELARETGKEMRELKSLKKRLQDLIKKEKILEEMLQKVERLGEAVGGLENINQAVENRVETVELVLEHAEESSSDPAQRFVEEVLEMHSEGKIYDLERGIIDDLDIQAPSGQNSLKVVTLCPTTLPGPDSKPFRSRRNSTLAAYLIFLRDSIEGNQRGRGKKLLEEGNIEYEDAREKLSQIYENIQDIPKDFFEIGRGYYVYPQELDLERRGEIVVANLPENLVSNLSVDETITDVILSNSGKKDNSAIRTTYFHCLIRHRIHKESSRDYSFLDILQSGDGFGDLEEAQKEMVLVDEGAAFAANLVQSEEIDPDSNQYRVFSAPKPLKRVAKAFASRSEESTDPMNSLVSNAIQKATNEQRRENFMDKVFDRR